MAEHWTIDEDGLHYGDVLITLLDVTPYIKRSAAWNALVSDVRKARQWDRALSEGWIHPKARSEDPGPRCGWS